MDKIEQLIREYKSLIAMCDDDLAKECNTGNLEIYIKGKKEAYERIITDLEKL